jgi:hypothetical protein
LPVLAHGARGNCEKLSYSRYNDSIYSSLCQAI